MKFGLLTLTLLISLLSFGAISPSFTCDATRGCSPLVVNATDHSTGATSWRWDLGNGNTSTQRNPSATYVNPGHYTIKLIVSNGSVTDSITQSITVFAIPSVNFTSDKTAACPNDSIQFTAQVTPGDAPVTQYAWGFGNGIASSQKDPSYKYTVAALYDVTLVVQDSNGCNANLTKPGYMRIWPTPVAAYTLTPQVSCGTSQVVSFTNQSTGSGLTYSWIFGDSAFSTLANPNHTYTAGKYKATLLATNNYGCTTGYQKNVSVIDLHADFAANKVLACAGEEITFQDLSPMPGTAWSWSFGDGNTSTRQNPKHIYNTPGTYNVTFVVRDAMCHDSATRVAYITITQGFMVSFAADQRNSCTTPFTVHFTSQSTHPATYSWDFGNGWGDTATNPTATFTAASTYNVTLTATDSNGCIVKSSVPGFINTSKPWTKFTGDTMTCPGTPVKFNNRTINGSHYIWNFGDGDTSSAINPTHIYQRFGNYTVSLTAIDSIGCDSTLVKPAFVHVDSAMVDFRVDQTFSMCPPLVSVFSSIKNRNDLKLRWDFGDGYTDTAANPTHIFFHPGVYTVRLIGTSKMGCTDTVTYRDLITVQGPSGQFHLTPNNGCVPVVVNFSGSTSANVQNITCDLGDGRLYNDSLNFKYSYNAVRIYHPKFILTDHVGCTVSYELDSITTHGSPVLHLQDTTVCPGQQVRMALGTDSYSWVARVCDTCGRIPNIIDTVSVATLTPEVTTTYTVTATNGIGCTTTDHFSINILPLPSLVPHDTIRMCRNESTPLSVGHADSIRWTPASFLSDATALSPVCSASSSVTYTATGYNRLGCSASVQVPVHVIDRVTVAISGDTSVCPGTPVQLWVRAIDSSLAGVNYAWSPAALATPSTSATPVMQMQSGAETFQVITRSGGCIPDTSAVTVRVSPAASVKLPANFVATAHTEVKLAPVSGDLTTYAWLARDSFSCTDCKSTVFTPVSSQAVYLTGTNQYGCVATDSMYINVLQCDPTTIFVPNTFTPNGDGLHDVLYLHSRTLSQLESFRVFDRWGTLVFEGKDVDQGWDGTINGTAAQQGVYIFTVTGKCEGGYDVQASGTVTLVR